MTTKPTGEQPDELLPHAFQFESLSSPLCWCGNARSRPIHMDTNGEPIPLVARASGGEGELLECQACGERSPIRTNPDQTLRDECPLCGARFHMVLVAPTPARAEEDLVVGAIPLQALPQRSELGEFWAAWFDSVGEHATVDVVHATTKLVIAEREIAVRDASSLTDAGLITLRDCRAALVSLPQEALGQHPEIGYFYRNELIAKIDLEFAKLGERIEK